MWDWDLRTNLLVVSGHLAEMLGYTVDESPEFWEAPAILPNRFRYLAFKAYQRELISVSKLAELLREDVFELRSKLQEADAEPAQTSDVL